MAKEHRVPYRGITYDGELSETSLLEKWKNENCVHNRHLFDEVKSMEHYLHCDACGLMVHIAHIETSAEAVARVERGEEPPPFVVIDRASLREGIK